MRQNRSWAMERKDLCRIIQTAQEKNNHVFSDFIQVAKWLSQTLQ